MKQFSKHPIMKLTRHLLFLIAAFCCTFGSLQAQQAPQPGAAPAAEAAPVHNKTLWETIKEGGWVMVPIGICSVLTLYLIGDGILRTGRKRVLPDAHVEAVKGLFRHGDYVGAYNYCKANPSPFTNVCRVAISLLGEGKQVAEEGMIGELAKENSQMQTYISYLSVIGVCAPMLGLTGTVTGMIRAFATLGASGIGDPSKLSAAIGEVLTATASGLFIAIPAFTAFYFLRNRAAKALHDIQDTMNSLFRKMPYEKLAGVQIGDEEIYAADPQWDGTTHGHEAHAATL
jgi:biopolymer transport protein ExbB